MSAIDAVRNVGSVCDPLPIHDESPPPKNEQTAATAVAGDTVDHTQKESP